MQPCELSASDRKHLAPVSVPRPAPGPGEALVAVDAVSLNYRDNLIMANHLGGEPPLPLVPASDMAAVVVDVGADVTRVHPGDRVITSDIAGWIVELGRVRAGQTVVVQGTGGVAVFAIQLALAHGARVIVTTSSEAKIGRLRRLGPVEAINRAVTPEWQHEIVSTSQAISGSNANCCMRCARWREIAPQKWR